MRSIQNWLSGLATCGGVLASFGAATCCALPLMLASAGLGTAWLGSIAPIFAPYRAPLLVIAAVLLLVGAGRLVWQFRLARTCPSDASCGSPIFRALTTIGLLLGTALFAGAIIYV
ncbi:mercuric transporter MerT family protein [Erythrobacter tepidarius]|uniref:mercuric transporter MerT family protein n=1 Tax=Erythrobacter tepidarius TaxID=60454 RepID=UPI000A38679F|nr:mercuric transporter MerT family protein [Erythrobacter tepidarius]